MKKFLSVIISVLLVAVSVPADVFSVPYSAAVPSGLNGFAKITSADFYDSDVTVINIQDLHNNREVQNNIYKLLEKLNEKYKDVEVFIEGASKQSDFSNLLKYFSDKELSVLMKSLFDNDKISGAEYFGYKNKKILNPVERKDIYDKNIQNYSFLIKNRKNIENLLEQKYEKIKYYNKYLNKNQIKILRLYNAYLNKKISCEKFYDKILKKLDKRNLSDLKYINIKLYNDIILESKKINRKKANIQLQSILLKLKNNISYSEYFDLLKNSNNFADMNIVFSYLQKNISVEDKISKYPDLFKLINLKEISSLVNPAQLIEEERQITEDVLLSYSENSVNKDIVFLNLFFEVYKKLLLAEISSKEYNGYKQNYDLFEKISSKYLGGEPIELFVCRRAAESFNELNIERNEHFVNNILLPTPQLPNSPTPRRGFLYSVNKILSTLDNKKIKVLVSGGFHTNGINELLTKNKISCVTLTPNVKDTDYSYKQNYLNSIIKQAEAEYNAISAEPFLQRPADIIVDDIMSCLDNILPSFAAGKSISDIRKKINDVIKENSVEHIVSFDMSDDGSAVIKIKDKEYVLDYSKGRVVIQTETFTALAKNIKILIREALKAASIRAQLGLKAEYEEDSFSGYNQTAEYMLMEHNILFPAFADLCLRTIVGSDLNKEHDKSTGFGVYNIFNAVRRENAFRSQFYDTLKDYDIKTGNSPALAGVSPDGYGRTQQYGMLFYVVWGKDENSADVAREILISEEFFKYLEKLKSKENEEAVREFLRNLLMHERLEQIAVSGKSEVFNDYVLKHKLSRTPEVFHGYILSSDFKNFIREQKLSSGNILGQQNLLAIMDGIIASVNDERSEYSDVISIVSLENGTPKYEETELQDFVEIRAGEKDKIRSYDEQLAQKLSAQIKKRYIAEQKILNPNYDIKKDFNPDDFIDFVNDFVVVYRPNSEYINCGMLSEELKRIFTAEFDVLKERTDEIKINSFELNEDGENFSLDKPKAVKNKSVIFAEDIISRQSSTFNTIYKLLIGYGAVKVQGAAFFDLSKESETGETISQQSLEYVLNNPKFLAGIIKNLDGKVQKYTVYWLTELLKTEDGRNTLSDIIEELRRADKTDNGEEIIKNLLHGLFDILNKKDFVKGVYNYDIVNLILFIGFGKDKKTVDITKEETDKFLQKYGLKSAGENLHDGSASVSRLTVVYDDWKKDISALILYAYMAGYGYINALGVNNIDGVENGNEYSNRKLIEILCRQFRLPFEDKKAKLKHTYPFIEENGEFAEKINEQKERLKTARRNFEEKIIEINERYGITAGAKLSDEEYKEYLKEIDQVQSQYSDTVKNIMIVAKRLTLDILSSRNIQIDEDLFLIMISGSLVKGSMMTNSDVYYDIIVPDGTVSKSVEMRFAPLYSSILQQIGLTNYHVVKYSASRLNKRNINTFIDEREVAPFLNYEVLSAKDRDKELYKQFMGNLLKERVAELKVTDGLVTGSFSQQMALIAKRYYEISKNGYGWIGNSFYLSYTSGSINQGRKAEMFSTRAALMLFEMELNLKLKYLNFDDDDGGIPVSVKAQIDFLKRKSVLQSEKDEIDEVYNAWRYLASCRYVKTDGSWTEFTDREQECINIINDFVSRKDPSVVQMSFPGEVAEPEKIEKKPAVTGYKDLLSVIEDFFYDNSIDIDVFKNGYKKYAHLQAWKQFAVETSAPNEGDLSNEDMFLFAQAVSLLIEIDSPKLRDKLRNLGINGLNEYLEKIFDSLDRIKMIDETFPEYSQIQGERSIQNYWDAVAASCQNSETLFALIAHKLAKAQISENPQDKLLVYSVYLPLSRRFGNAEIYEYVRNDLFECSHPGEYLNLLKIIKTLFGISYSGLSEINENLRSGIYGYLEQKGFSKQDVHIKYRVKSLYSIYEKLTSARKKDDKDLKTLTDTEKSVIGFMADSKEHVFTDMLKRACPGKTPRRIKKELTECLDTVSKNNSLSEQQQQLIESVLEEMKKSVFSDYRVAEYVDMVFSRLFNGKEVFDDSEKLKKYLKEENEFFVLWFVEFFEDKLKDLVGLHIIVSDDKYDGVVSAVADKNKTAGKKYEKFSPYGVLVKFFSKIKMFFSKFEKDTGNKQARLKLNAALIQKLFPVPIEICFYEHSDYNNETFGLYNSKKISAPHQVYKMGKDFVSWFFGHIFSRELNFDFIEDSGQTGSQQQAKRMVFISDEYVPQENFNGNFNEITKKISDSVTCFVEFDGGVYIQKLPKGSTVFDLVTGRYFADDVNAAVYDEYGEPLSSDMVLDDSKKYTIIKNSSLSTDFPVHEAAAHTVRAKLIFKRKNFLRKSDVTLKHNSFSKFVQGIIDNFKLGMFLNEERQTAVSVFEKLTMMFFDNAEYKAMLDERYLTCNEMAEKIIEDGKYKHEYKTVIADFLHLLFYFIDSKDLSYLLPSEVIKRSLQIANHYNLANIMELFEAVDYGLIDFNDIKNFYSAYVSIKTKSSGVTESSILECLDGEGFDYNELQPEDKKYNLVINGKKYFVKDMDEYFDFIEMLNENFSGEENGISVSVDFMFPEKPLPLMSLGNNLESLAGYAAEAYPDMVKRILDMTERIAHSENVSSITPQDLSALTGEYPVLTAQILLGLFSRDAYDAKQLSLQTPFLTKDHIEYLKRSVQTELVSNGVFVSEVNISVSKTLDLVQSEDTYSFATLDVSGGVVTLFISEAFLRQLDKLPSDEKEYMLLQLAKHETSEYIALSSGSVSDYAEFHKRLEKDLGQKRLTDFAKSVVPDVLRMKNCILNVVDVLNNLQISSVSSSAQISTKDMDNVRNDVNAGLLYWTEILAHTLNGDIVPVFDKRQGLKEIPNEMFKDILFLVSVLNDTEKSALFKIFETASRKNENFRTKDGVLKLLENYVDTDSAEYKLISEFISYIYSDTSLRDNLVETAAETLSADLYVETGSDNLHYLLASA